MDFVADGTVIGNTIEFNWADVPKGNATLYGTLKLNIISDNELKVFNQTGGWGGENWDQMSLVRSTDVTNPFAATKGRFA